MKDRIVEHPHRYRLKAVPGEDGVYDLEPVPGVVTEVGTPLNKASLLSDNTAGRLGLAETTASPDIAFRRSNLSSFQAFCANTNMDSLNAAFGKGNEARLCGLGRQLSMYAWYKGEVGTFSSLSECDSLQDIINVATAYGDCMSSTAIHALILSCPYAKDIFQNALFERMELYKTNYAIMRGVLSDAATVDAIRNDAVTFAALASSRTVYTESGSLIVPSDIADRDCIVVEMIGSGQGGEGGNNGSSWNGGDGGDGGEYKLFALPVDIEEAITWTITPVVTIKDISAITGGGAKGGENSNADDAQPYGRPLSQTGKLTPVGAGGKEGVVGGSSGCGGGGGILFPNYPSGGRGGTSTKGGYGGMGFGAGGGGGYRYGTGAGAGASGAIAIYL